MKYYCAVARQPSDIPKPRGRPRDNAIDDRVTQATLTLLAAHGYSALTLDAVAKEAGVTRPTLYRRWSGKAALVVAALGAAAPPLVASSTSDALADLRETAVDFIVRLGESGYAGTIFAVHAEARHDPELAALVFGTYLLPRAILIDDIISRARKQGTIRADLSNGMVRDLVFGPLVYNWLVVGEVPGRDGVGSLADAALRAVRV